MYGERDSNSQNSASKTDAYTVPPSPYLICVAPIGIEPITSDSKSDVLPLHHRAITNQAPSELGLVIRLRSRLANAILQQLNSNQLQVNLVWLFV